MHFDTHDEAKEHAGKLIQQIMSRFKYAFTFPLRTDMALVCMKGMEKIVLHFWSDGEEDSEGLVEVQTMGLGISNPKPLDKEFLTSPVKQKLTDFKPIWLYCDIKHMVTIEATELTEAETHILWSKTVSFLKLDEFMTIMRELREAVY